MKTKPIACLLFVLSCYALGMEKHPRHSKKSVSIQKWSEILIQVPFDKKLHLSYSGPILKIEHTGWGTDTINLIKYITLCGDQKIELLNICEKSNYFYILLQVSGPSRPWSPQGQCGAGFEINLVWLRVIGNQIQGINADWVQSCWEGTQDDAEYSTNDDLMVWKVNYYIHRPNQDSAYRKKIITYDLAHPGRGLQVDEDLPNNPED